MNNPFYDFKIISLVERLNTLCLSTNDESYRSYNGTDSCRCCGFLHSAANLAIAPQDPVAQDTGHLYKIPGVCSRYILPLIDSLEESPVSVLLMTSQHDLNILLDGFQIFFVLDLIGQYLKRDIVGNRIFISGVIH